MKKEQNNDKKWLFAFMVTPDLVRLREIEVQREAVAKWDGVLPKVTGGAVPFIDVKVDEA